MTEHFLQGRFYQTSPLLVVTYAIMFFPLAVVSADERASIKFISAGAVSFMTKPLKIAEVERSMVTLLDVFPAR